MYLCDTYNLSIGIPALRYNKWIITEDGKTIKGLIGKELQSFIESRKSFAFKCKLINVFKIGSKLKNGSYDGALGAIDKKEIDVFVKTEIPLVDNKNVCFSYPVYTEDFLIYQSINKKELDQSELKLQLVKSFSLEYFLYYFLSATIVLLLFSIYSLLYFKLFSIKKIKTKNWFKKNFFLLKKNQLEKIIYLNLFLLGLILLNFFTKQFIINNVNTTRIIVDTNEFITDEDKIFESPLKAVWFDGESDLSIVKNAPRDTFLHKLFLKKNENPIKTIERRFTLRMIILLKTYFIFMKSYTLRLVINLLRYFQEQDGFLNEKPFYSIYSVFYISKNIDPEKIKFLYKFSQKSSQAGLIMKLKNRVLSLKLFEGPRKAKIYYNLNSYINDFTKFDSLNYQNFHLFFLAFLIIDLLVLFFFTLNQSIIKLRLILVL